MNHGSLFSGIGGFDLAAQWMGWENIFHCEINEFPRKILNHYWPNAISHEDITKTDFTIYRNRIDIITGGFPCQPNSLAGQRKGKEDERHLWPEMLRAISEIQPTWVIGENVSGLLNWNDGLVFHEVQTDLEAKGYEVQPFLLPAASKNAPHQRERIWFVAYNNNRDRKKKRFQARRQVYVYRFTRNETYTNSNSKRGRRIYNQSQKTRTRKGRELSEGIHRVQFFTNSTSGRRLQILHNAKRRQPNGYSFNPNIKPNDWANFPTQPPLCNGDDGLSSRLDAITFPKWRSESIKGGGNAIVPQVALNIFKSIELFNKEVLS